ncbi:RNA methyltransferase [Gangjinia marincola]|uniref:RNA methyltransferase n=2 Tax=Gangjinia marincola TaxID=578463 RepID=A0ABP3XUF7_9FLAO
MHKKITSLSNPVIKQLLQLQQKSKVRRKQKQFVVEGQREITLAVQNEYLVDTLFFAEELIDYNAIESTIMASQVIAISTALYEKVAYRGSTEGLIAIVQSKEHRLQDLNFSKNPFLLIAEAPEKPGNIGALLRTADAAGVDAVIIANPRTDIYNPNIIRSSVGGIFTNHIAAATINELSSFLDQHSIMVYGAALQASVPYTSIDFNQPCAIAVGTEADGLSHEFLEITDQNIIIPMQGKIDSMNVSVAAGILLFEARKQRGFVS